jgi:hypothetical protein
VLGAFTKKEDDTFETFKFNISYNELENEGWISKNLPQYFILYDKKVYNELKTAIKTSCKLLQKDNKIIYSKCMGWVKGINEWHYVPNSNSKDKSDLSYDKNLEDNYKIRVDRSLEDDTPFKETLKIIDSIDKKIAIPILSYTLLSANLSLIKKQNIFPNLLLNIYGLNSNINNIEVANIFANVFNRTKLTRQLDMKFHISIDQDEKEIKEKILIMRDCVTFVSDIDMNNSKHVNKIKNIISNFNSDSSSTGIIFLSNGNIPLDSLFNLDITNKNINLEELNEYKEKPLIFSTLYMAFINSLKNHLDKYGKINYKHRLKKIQKKFFENNIQIDPITINKVSWLLFGYRCLLKFGTEINAIETEEEFDEMLLEAFNALTNTDEVPKINTTNEKDEIEKLACTLLDGLQKLISEKRIATSYDEFENNKEFFGWSNEEFYFLKPKETKEYIKEFLNESDDKKLSSIFEYMFTNDVIIGQYEKIKDSDKTRFRYDFNEFIAKGNYKRFIKIYKVKMN